jgi:hypothetical protein
MFAIRISKTLKKVAEKKLPFKKFINLQLKKSCQQQSSYFRNKNPRIFFLDSFHGFSSSKDHTGWDISLCRQK